MALRKPNKSENSTKAATNKKELKEEATKKASPKSPKKGADDLKDKAKENTTVVHRKDRNEVVTKQGNPKDHAPRHNMNQGKPSHNPRTAGISVGVTKNMGDYESLRIDCWLTDELLEGETQREALVRLGDIVQEQVEYEVDRVIG